MENTKKSYNLKRKEYDHLHAKLCRLSCVFFCFFEKEKFWCVSETVKRVTLYVFFCFKFMKYNTILKRNSYIHVRCKLQRDQGDIKYDSAFSM